MAEFGVFLVKECSPLRRQIVADIDALLTSVQRETAEANRAAESVFDQSKTLLVSVTVCTLLACIAIAVAITRGLLRQLGGEPTYAAAIATRIAQGELAIDVATRPRRYVQPDLRDQDHARQPVHDRRPGPCGHREYRHRLGRNRRRES